MPSPPNEKLMSSPPPAESVDAKTSVPSSGIENELEPVDSPDHEVTKSKEDDGVDSEKSDDEEHSPKKSKKKKDKKEKKSKKDKKEKKEKKSKKDKKDKDKKEKKSKKSSKKDNDENLMNQAVCPTFDPSVPPPSVGKFQSSLLLFCQYQTRHNF